MTRSAQRTRAGARGWTRAAGGCALAAAAIAGATAGPTGCARAPAWPPRAVDVALGEEACAECRMIVSDGRFAVQLHAPGGKAPAFFDDLCCLVREAAAAAEAGRPIDLAGVFVRDYSGDGWVRGSEAWVVHASGIVSPMASGYASFGAHARAQAEAARHLDGRVAPLADVVGGSPSG